MHLLSYLRAPQRVETTPSQEQQAQLDSLVARLSELDEETLGRRRLASEERRHRRLLRELLELLDQN